jgi:WS/DGAT C-terminal domain/Wax ester synthase-like Acyl-CoA acyltransferase domain
VTARLDLIPGLRRHLLPSTRAWERPRWVVDGVVNVDRRVQEVTLEEAGCETLDDLVSQFFSVPLDPRDLPWEMLLVRGLTPAPAIGDDGSTSPTVARTDAVVVKIHHSLGDSFTLIGALGALLDQDGARPGQAENLNAGRMAWACSVSEPASSLATASLLRIKARRTYRVISGLAGMVSSGPPPWRFRAPGPKTKPPRGQDRLQRRNPTRAVEPQRPFVPLGSGASPRMTGLATSPQGASNSYPERKFVGFSLPARAVTIAARRLRTNVPDLLLALIAEATCNLRGAPAASGSPERRHLRVMVPHTVRLVETSTRSTARSRLNSLSPAGNRTAGVLLDLPVFPMEFEDRVAAVRQNHSRCLRRGDAEAAAFVLRTMNALPAWLQRQCTRAVYSGQLLGVIVSVFPGVRRKCRLFGAPVEHMYPVLALADGTDMAIGAMTWGASISVGLLGACRPDFDPGLLALEIEKLFYQWSASSPRTSFVPTA